MEPNPLGPAEWNDIGNLLTNLWFMVGMIVLFATNMTIGHIGIPSLVASHHIPRSINKSRPIFYVLALISFMMFVYFLVKAIDIAVLTNGGEGVVDRFFQNYWI